MSLAVTSSSSGRPGCAEPRDSRLHMPPGAVGRPDPAGEVPGRTEPRSARTAAAVRTTCPRSSGCTRPGSRAPASDVRRVPVVRDRLARVADQAGSRRTSSTTSLVRSASWWNWLSACSASAEIAAACRSSPRNPGDQGQREQRTGDERHRPAVAPGHNRKDEGNEAGRHRQPQARSRCSAADRYGLVARPCRACPRGASGRGARTEQAECHEPGQLRPGRRDACRWRGPGRPGSHRRWRRTSARYGVSARRPARIASPERAAQDDQVGDRMDEVDGEQARTDRSRRIGRPQDGDPADAEARARTSRPASVRRPGSGDPAGCRGRRSPSGRGTSRSRPTTSGGSPSSASRSVRVSWMTAGVTSPALAPCAANAAPQATVATASHRLAASPWRARRISSTAAAAASSTPATSRRARTGSSRTGGCVRLHRACVHQTSCRLRPERPNRTVVSEPGRRRGPHAVQGGHACGSSLSDGSTRRADGANSPGRS